MEYFGNIMRYLEAKRVEEGEKEEIRKEAGLYELKEGALHEKESGFRVVAEKELFQEVVNAVHNAQTRAV